MENEEAVNAYFSLYLHYAAGMIGTVLTTNLAAFFMFFELMLIPSWALINRWGTGPKERIAFKYFMFTEVGALLLLAGIAYTYALTGSFNLFQIAQRTINLPLATATIISILILIGLFVKMAIFPLHTWLPDAHAEAPTPISALLSPAMIGIGGYAAIRILYTIFPTIFKNAVFSYFLLVLSLVTMIYGATMAYAQRDIKRLLAYSSISQMGYLLFGIATGSSLAIVGSILIAVNPGLSKAVLCRVSGIFIHELKTRDIGLLGGLGSKMPVTAISSLLGFLGLAGVPPLIGFWSEFILFFGSMKAGLIFSLNPNIALIMIVSIATVATVLSAGYGLWTIQRVFYKQLPEKLRDAREASLLMIAPIFVLAVLAVILGVYPTPLINLINPTVASLIGS